MWLDRDHDFDDLKSSEFWKSYLEGLEKAFGWEIFSDYGQIRPLEGENIGVGGVRIYVSKELKDQEVLNSLREFSKDVQVVLNKSTVKEKRLTGLLEKENLLDIVHVNLSLRDFSVDRVWSEEKGKKISSLSGSKKHFESGEIVWRDPQSLIEAGRAAKLRAFLSIESKELSLMNIWSNFVARPTKITTSETLVDMIRAYITVQLLTIRNDNKEKFENIGELSETKVILTGDLIKLLPEKILVMSLIDGLEISGQFDLVIDETDVLTSFGQSIADGADAKDILVHIYDMWERQAKVYIPGISGGNKQRRAIFTAMYEGEGQKRKDIFALSGSITDYDFPKHITKLLFEAKFEQGAYLFDGDMTHSFISDPNRISFNRVHIDARLKPIVYGPEPRRNLVKLSAWLDEEN